MAAFTHDLLMASIVTDDDRSKKRVRGRGSGGGVRYTLSYMVCMAPIASTMY